MKKELLIGSHVSMSAPDYLVGSLNEALSYKANAFMIYTGAPQNSKRVELSKLKIDEFKIKLKENNIAIENVIVHAPYIINLASVNPYKHKIAIDVLKNEIIRTNAIGCKYLVLHPGNAVDCDIDTGINNIANSINEILDSLSDNSVVICLERAATFFGVSFAFNHLSSMILLALIAGASAYISGPAISAS